MKKYIFSLLFLGAFSFNQDILSGYLRTTDASVCMDECGLYHIESEFDTSFGSTPVIFRDDVDTSLYLNRFVEIMVDEEEVNCIECSALQILEINLSDDCNYPVDCFADPCDMADECQLNTPVECVSNYCGGCYSDFYDLDNNLVYCYGEGSGDEEDNDFEDECRYFETEDECVDADCEWDDEDGCYGNWDEDEDIFCSDIDNPEECIEIGCEWEYSNNMPGAGYCFEVDDNEDWEDDDNLECSDFETEEECRLNECDWELTPAGVGYCIELGDDNGEPSPCSDFGQEDCEWFDECVWTDNGCQDFDWEDDSFSCEELSQDECSETEGCIWEYSNNMPGGGYCIDGNNEEDDGPPECVLDCEGVENVDPNQDGMYFCEWLLTIFPSGCAEDCEQEVLNDIEEFMQVCDECLPMGDCDDYFNEEDGDDLECSDFETEEECRLNECDWQLTPAGVGQCVESGEDDSVCEDLSDIFFGWCEMIIGAGWNGDECVWYSGCSTMDENGIDYSDSLFDSMEECELVCSDNQQEDGFLFGTVEYVWGDAIEMVSGATIQITSANSFYIVETNEQGFYGINLPQGQYSVNIEAYGEFQTQDIYIMSNQEHELNFQFGDWYYPSYAMLRLESVTASPGQEISVPLILESNLDVAGIQFSVNYVGLAGNYLYPTALNSMNDCFTANFNDLNGEFIGIIFSFEGCSYSAGESHYIADLVFEVSDNVPSGSEAFLNFSNTIVSDVEGNPISSYGEGASILFGLQGDVNSDSSVNVLDIVMIVNFAIYIEEPTQSQFWASDINNDDLINILDIVQVVNLILDN